MAEILSQSEIDELLLALTTGREEPAKPQEETEDSVVKPYNFRTANKFNKEQMRMLRFIYENYAGRLSTFLSGALRAVCDVEVVSLEEQTFGEFSNSLPSPAFIAIYSMEPLAGNSLIELSNPVAYEIISRLFGGTGQFTDSNKMYTEIEVAILTQIVRKMLGVMTESWERICAATTRLDRIETSAQFAQIVAASEPIAIITMNITVGEVSDIINLCIPHIAIQPIAKKLASKQWYTERADGGEESFDIKLNPLIGNTYLTLHAVLDTTEATVRDIVNLEVGDVIRIDHTIDKNINILVEHMLKFKGVLGQKGQKSAVKITEIIKGDTEHGLG